MFEYIILNHGIKAAFHFEMVGGNVKRLVYDPFMYDYFQENTVNFQSDLLEILIKTKFDKLLGVSESKLKETIDHLDFSRKIIFNYKKGTIQIST